MALSRKRGWNLGPFYFLIIWGLLALLLVINGTYELRRTRDNLYHLLLDKGSTLVEGLEKSIQATFSSLAAAEAFPGAAALISSPVNLLELDDATINYLLELAFLIDRDLGDSPSAGKLKQLEAKEHFSRVEWITPSQSPSRQSPRPFYQAILEGRAAYAIHRWEKKATGQMEQTALAVARRSGSGILLLQVDETELHFFRRRIILQGLLEEWKDKAETRHIVIQGEDSEILADTDPTRIGEKEESSLWRQALLEPIQGRTQSRRTGEILELARPVVLDRNTRGVLRVDLSTAGLEKILDGERKNIVFLSMLLLVLGGAGIAIIYRMEKRHLARVREMEEKVYQSEKLSSLANLAAGVAHEIRNPLNAIGMVIQRLQREFTPERPESKDEYQRFTDLLRSEVKRVNEIIEQFLFFARPARLDRREIPIQEVLQDVLFLAREPAEQQGIVLLEEIDPSLPPLWLDRQRIQEALWNLISNALQAMVQGGRLQLRARLEGRNVAIEIGDTGPGIPAENMGKIFDYYFTTKERGLGLGLSLAHKIIQEHGGVIQAKSQVGQGATFQVYLPLSKGGS